MNIAEIAQLMEHNLAEVGVASFSPVLGDDAFYKCGVDLDGDKMWYINVLSGCAEIFKTTGNWAKYADIIREWTPTD